jgi:PGF-CTERM protein
VYEDIMGNNKISVTLPVLLLLSLAVLALSAGCLKESSVAVTDLTVGADKVTGAEVTLNVSTEIQNVRGVSTGISRVQLRAYDTTSGLVVAEKTGDAGFLGIRGTGVVTREITLPRTGSYRLVSTVFENGQRKGQGEKTVYNLERLTPDMQEIGLSITDIDFQVKKVAGDRATIQTDIYFTNDNRVPSGAFDIEVKAKEEDARLLADKQRAHLESIQPDATRVSGVALSVPDQYNYVVEVIVWKNETIVKRGEGYVRLRPGMLVKDDTQFVTRKIETSKFISEEGYQAGSYGVPVTKSPGFGAPLALVAIGALAVLVRCRRREP